MKKINDSCYECEFGVFYKIFARRDDSWEFKSKRLLDEKDLEFALKTVRELKSGATLDSSAPKT